MTVTLDNIKTSGLPEKLKQRRVTADQRISVSVTTLSDEIETLPSRSLDEVARIISERATVFHCLITATPALGLSN